MKASSVIINSIFKPMKLFTKYFKRKQPQDYLTEYVNENLIDLYHRARFNNTTKLSTNKKELIDYCFNMLAEKKYKKEMDQFYRSCMKILR